ncbi:MAG TPA: glycosyltransferase family 4 protein [Candidatus Didemnitutus sp.]|jgi:glycosyltransferase involved in cell wall biosynthesis
MHLVVVCQVFHPDEQSTSQLLTDLCRSLDAQGVRVTVVSGFTTSVASAFPPTRERLGGIEIRRTGLRLHYRGGILRRVLHYFAFLAGATWELMKIERRSIVLGISNPPFMPIWLWLAAAVLGLRFQLVLQDIYPDGLVAAGVISERGLTARSWRAANRRAFAAADRIVVLGRDMKRLVETRYGISKEKVSSIPHWSVASDPPATDCRPGRMLGSPGLAGKFVVQYSGNMGLWHDLDSIVEAAAILRERDDIHFVLIGDGRRRRAAGDRAGRLGLTNVTWLPYQPRRVLAESLASCNVALISQREGLEGIAVPCKLYGILGSGRPVIAMVPAESETGHVVREEKCGFVVSPGDPAALAAAIVVLGSDSDRCQTMGANALRAARDTYTLAIATRRYLDLWGELAGKRNGESMP